MGLAQSRTFRGSAAFFAMLLAAAPAAAGADFAGPDNLSSDRPAPPHACDGCGLSAVSASKFTRRRQPFARRMIENAQRS